MKRSTLGILAFVLLSLAAVQQGLGQSYAYVCNVSADTVTAIDLENRELIATVPVGDEPYYVVLTPDGSRAYVTNRNSNTVSVIDTGTNTVVDTIHVGVTPWQLAITPDGSRVYVVNYGQSGPGSVSVISTATNTIVATIPVSNWPRAIAMTPDGTKAYIACQASNSVSVIDTVNNVRIKDIYMSYGDSWPGSIAMSPDGTTVYVGNVVSNSLAVINTAADALVGSFRLPICPDDIEFKPDGLQVYITTSSGSLSILDVLTRTVTGTVEVCSTGTSLAGIVMGSGGDRAYVAGQGCDSVGVIDTAGNTLVASIPAGPTPLGIAVVPLQNHPPVAQSQTVAANAGEPVEINLTAADEDGDPMTVVIISLPSHGTLDGEAANRIYTAEITYYGQDSFIFKVNDGSEDSNEARITIAVNHVPYVGDQSVTSEQNTSVTITLGDSTDIDGDPLTYQVITPPANGSISILDNQAVYMPAPGYFGPDAFTFQANDKKANSNIGTVIVEVTRLNTAPVAQNQTVIANWNSDVFITLMATDPERDPLTYIIVSPPTHGQLSGAGPIMTLTLEAGFYGSDSFTFKANDGWVDSESATVSIRIERPFTAPVAEDQAVATDEDQPVNITLSASDEDGDPLTYDVLTGPAHGTLGGTAPNLTYTPQTHYFGPDTFTFKANDGTADSELATVSITVRQVNSAPVPQGQAVTTDENQPVHITLTATDEDGDPLTYSIETSPAHGALAGTAPNLTYTPHTQYVGPDTFTFKANDGTADSELATVSITVRQVNSAPVAQGQAVTTDENRPVQIMLTATDEDGDPLTYSIVTSPAHGDISGTAPDLVYTPRMDYYGPDVFTFKASDGTVDSGSAAVSITVKRIFAFTGFESPVDNPVVVNSAKAGSAVPVKWLITDLDGTPIADPASFVGLTSYAVSCQTLSGDPVDAVETYAGASGLQYVGDGHWQFNWKTPKSYARQCRVMVLTLADGSTHLAYFTFK